MPVNDRTRTAVLSAEPAQVRRRVAVHVAVLDGQQAPGQFQLRDAGHGAQYSEFIAGPKARDVVVAAHREHLAGELPQLLQNPGAADVACVHGQGTAPYDLEDVRAQVPMRVRYDGHADGAGSC